MTDCDRALELISAGLDGALTPEEKDWLEKHLEHCPACRALAAEFSALHQLLPTLAPEPPAELKGRVMDAVRAEKTVPFHDQTRKKPWRRPIHWQQWAAVAAVVLLAVGGVRGVYAASTTFGGPAPALLDASAGVGLPAEDASQTPQAARQEVLSPDENAAQESAKTSGGTGTERMAEPYGTAQSEPDEAGGQAGITTMMAAPTPAPLDEAGALEALLAHLGLTEADGAGFASLGLREDGAAWRFRRTADGAVYAVPLDGGEITLEPAAEQTE